MNIEIPILHKSELTNRRVKVQDWGGGEWCGGVVLDIVAVYQAEKSNDANMRKSAKTPNLGHFGPFCLDLCK